MTLDSCLLAVGVAGSDPHLRCIDAACPLPEFAYGREHGPRWLVHDRLCGRNVDCEAASSCSGTGTESNRLEVDRRACGSAPLRMLRAWVEPTELSVRASGERWRGAAYHASRGCRFYRFWAGVGEHPDRILAVPPREEFRRWTFEYEREQFAYSEGGRAVVEATLDDFAARLPAPARSAGREALIASMDDHLRSTHTLPRPSRCAHALAAGAARSFAAAKKVLLDPSDRSWADHFRAPERHGELAAAGSG